MIPRPRLCAVAFVLLVLACMPGAAAPAESEAATVERLERYLESVRTLRSAFLQIAPSGAVARGTLYLQRPGRLRIDYDPPPPVTIIADGTWLIYVDTELDEANRTFLSRTMAGLLVREDLPLGGAVEVVGLRRAKGVLRLTLRRAEAPEEGTLALTFTDSPVQLRQWAVTNAEGETTTVALVDPRFGVELDPKLFEFISPERLERRE